MAVVESINTSSSISGNIEYLMNESSKDKTISDVYYAVTGSSSDTLYKRTVKIDTKLESIASAIGVSNDYLSSLVMGSGMGVDQDAILAVELDATGDAKDFMKSLSTLAALDDINLIAVSNGLDSLGTSVDDILKKDYSKVDGVLGSLEKLTTGLQAASDVLPSFKQLAGISGGIALMGLSIASFVGAIGFDDILKMGLIFGTISLASTLLKGTSRNLTRASIGVATMGLSIWAFNELIDGVALAEFATSLLTLGGSVMLFDRLFSKSAATTSKSLLLLSAGVGVLGVSLLAYDDVEWGSIAKASAALGGIGLASMLIGKGVSDTAALSMLGISAAVGVLGLSLQVYSDISASDVGVALLALGGVTGIAFLLGKIGSNALIGAASIGGIGLAMGVLAYGLGEINALDLSWEDAGVIAATIGITAGAFAAIGIPAVAALIGLGALASAGMGGALTLLSHGLNSVKTVDLTSEDAARFGVSLGHVKDAIANLGEEGGIIALGLGMAQAALITVATLPLILTMNQMSKMKTPSEATMEGFSRTVDALKNTFTQFGFFDLVELAAVTPIMLLMAGSTLALGGAIKLFSFLATDPEKIEGAIGTLDQFLEGLSSTFLKYDDSAFEVLDKGIDATMGIGKLLLNLSLGVSAISKEMEANTDFHGIGVSVGSMLSALTEPLAKIGGKQDTFSIAGFTITNPFSNKVESGVEALQGLGNVFMPISEMLKTFNSTTDNNVVDTFETNIVGILGTLGSVFESFEVDEDSNLDDLKKGTTIIGAYVDKLTKAKYDGVSNGFTTIANSAKSLKTSINDIDIDKLSKMSDMFYHLASIENNSFFLTQLMYAFKDFVKTLEKVTNQSTGGTVIETREVSADDKKDGKKTKVVANDGSVNVSEQLSNIINDGNTGIIEKLDELNTLLMSGTITVITKPKQVF